jgi:hypothetical protein
MRQTKDADIVVSLIRTRPDDLIAGFPDPYQMNRQDIIEAQASSAQFRTVQLFRMDEAFKMDLFILGDGPYERTELERARTIEIAPGLFVRFSAPENTVLAKLRWYVPGNRVSDRQWNDIVHVLEVQRGRLDEEYLDHWSAHFQVAPLLNEARAQAFE